MTAGWRAANLNLIPLQPSRAFEKCSPDSNGEMTQWLNEPTSSQLSPILYDQNDVSTEETSAEDDSSFLFPQFSQPLAFEQHFASSTQSMTMLNPPQIANKSFILGGNGGFESTRSSILAEPCRKPPELPFLISGVESSLHRRLFYHFTHVTSRVLTISGDDANPMNTIVIPLALSDKTLLQTLLALACSHLLKLQQSGINAELCIERYRLHNIAAETQAQRIHVLKGSAAAIGSQFSSQDRETIFATSLVLCLYEICEGTGDDSWRTHLDMAREVLSVGSTTTTTTATTTTTTTLNPFLLEFFLYHDSLAMVTVPSTAPRFKCTTTFSDQNPALVGVQDGLIEYVTRISSLRSEARPSSFPPNYDIVNKALAIWEDLFRWKPKVTLCKERKLIAEFYQWALFIWLFSIIYPDGKSDPIVQSAVQWMTTGMSDIKSGDGVMACLLFPLFVVGSAAIRQEDRNAVTKLFMRVRAWSSLGNVDLTYKVVEKMWEEHDEGMPRCWDWVMQLERYGMSLLVT